MLFIRRLSQPFQNELVARVACRHATRAPLASEDITEGIVRGLAQDEARKEELIERITPKILKKTVSRFAGIGEDEFVSGESAEFELRQKVYILAVLRKTAVEDPA